MSELKACFCGEIPESLHLEDNGCKWAFASGSCCNEWSIEFRTNYYKLDSTEIKELAAKAWNESKRGKDPRIKAMLDKVDALRLFYCGGKITEFTGGKVFAAKEILTELKVIADRSEGEEEQGWYENEADRLRENNAELCSAIKAIYSYFGEDERLAKMCNAALSKYEE